MTNTMTVKVKTTSFATTKKEIIMTTFASNTPCPECGCLTSIQVQYTDEFLYQCDECDHVHDGEGRFLSVQAAKALQGQGVDVVEVILTSFQTGAEYEVVRNWDNCPSAIGSIQVRAGRENGKRQVAKGTYSPHIGAAA
jgi:ribosomal protein L37AE/L43A